MGHSHYRRPCQTEVNERVDDSRSGQQSFAPPLPVAPYQPTRPISLYRDEHRVNGEFRDCNPSIHVTTSDRAPFIPHDRIAVIKSPELQQLREHSSLQAFLPDRKIFNRPTRWTAQGSSLPSPNATLQSSRPRKTDNSLRCQRLPQTSISPGHY